MNPLKKVTLLPALALAGCSGQPAPKPVTPTPPTLTVAPASGGFSLTSASLTVFVNTQAACSLSADNLAATAMTKVDSAYSSYAYTTALKAGTYANTKVTCVSSAGTSTKSFGTVTVGG